MPLVQAPSKILVTGASGFLAAHICRILLEHGFQVVGTVRDAKKGEYLQHLFESFQRKFTFIVIEDIQETGCFDEAVKGVDAVVHTASPFHLVADDPQDIIGPAVKGTTGILESILKNGHGVKRVIITSSTASIIGPKSTVPYTFTEADWNTYSVELIQKEGKNAPGGHKYRASKTLAERSAWEFVVKHGKDIKFDLTTINPTLVFGPPIHEVSSFKHLNESLAQFHAYITSPPNEQSIIGSSGNYVDVRDTALAHVLALEIESAGGERFILSNGPFTIQKIYDILREAAVSNIPEGYPGQDQAVVHNPEDGSKATRLLGLKYTTMKETVIDTLNSIQQRFPAAAAQ